MRFMTNYVCSRLSASRSFEQSHPFHRCQVTYGITKLALDSFEILRIKTCLQNTQVELQLSKVISWFCFAHLTEQNKMAASKRSLCRNNCWFARDFMAAILVVKNKNISLLWELNSIFMYCKFFEKKFNCIDPQHSRLVTYLQTKNQMD